MNPALRSSRNILRIVSIAVPFCSLINYITDSHGSRQKGPVREHNNTHAWGYSRRTLFRDWVWCCVSKDEPIQTLKTGCKNEAPLMKNGTRKMAHKTNSSSVVEETTDLFVFIQKLKEQCKAQNQNCKAWLKPGVFLFFVNTFRWFHTQEHWSKKATV